MSLKSTIALGIAVIALTAGVAAHADVLAFKKITANPRTAGGDAPNSQDSGGASGDDGSCEAKDEEIASLQSRLDSMTTYAISLQTQMIQTDEQWQACLNEVNARNQDTSDKTTCNLVLSFLGGPQASALCELIGNT